MKDFSLAFTAYTTVILSLSCTQMGKVEFKLSGSHSGMAKLTKITPIVARPKDTIKLVGKNFSGRAAYKIIIPTTGGLMAEVPVTVLDSSSGTFQMPEGAGLGLKTAEFQVNGKRKENFLIVADQPSNSLPIIIADQDKVCSSDKYIDRNGETMMGTRNCTGFSAEENAKFIPSNIKSGVAINGVVGTYPSASNPLKDASSEADLDTATFNAKIKSSSTFEYWDSSGVRQTGNGSTSLTAANIANGVSIFGETGSLIGTASLNAWDLRAGVTAGPVTGRLKTDCRNSAVPGSFDMADFPQAASVDHTTETFTLVGPAYANDTQVRFTASTSPTGISDTTTYYVMSSAGSNFQLSSTPSPGTTLVSITSNGSNVLFYRQGSGTADIWDTLDDYLSPATTRPTYPNWTANNQCQGLTTNESDSEVWVDATTAAGDGVTPSNCNAHPSACSIRDKITKLEWSKPDGVTRNWTSALSNCDGLTYNGKFDWRLPTQKELLSAYSHGIASTAGGNWLTLFDVQQFYWSSTTPSGTIHNAYNVSLGYGTSVNLGKHNGPRVICVRP